MLHQTLLAHRHAHFPAHTADLFRRDPTVVELLESARATIENDPKRARLYLDQLAAIFDETDAIPLREAILEPAPIASDNKAQLVKGGLAPWQVRRVSDHIDQHLSGTIPVETLARVAQLSSGHFCRAFKISVGETAHNFVIRQRVRRAQTLMLTTNDNLSQIACACGLTDQAHLTRLFRRFTGKTPLTWRRMWQQPPHAS